MAKISDMKTPATIFEDNSPQINDIIPYNKPIAIIPTVINLVFEKVNLFESNQ